MRDYSNNKYQGKKIAANRVKIQRKPRDLKKYLRPLMKGVLGVAGLAVVAGIVFVAWKGVASTTFCRLKTIEVANAKRLSKEEILALAGVEPGNDLLRMNLKQMGEHILQNPWVETVHIKRFLPDGVTIAITEREPLAIVNMGYIYYLDKKGTVFKVLNQGDKLDFPVVTGFSEEELNSDPNGTKEALKSTCELLKILQEKGAFILADVSEIHYDKGFGFTMFTASGGLPIKIGTNDFAAKIERFAKIYRDVMAQRPVLQYIDLDYTDKIIIKKS